MRFIKTLLSITIGIIIANLLIEMKLNKYFEKILEPFIRFSRLKSEVWLGVFTRILSPYAGYEILHRFHERGKINEREIIIVTLITPFPYEIIRIFNYYLPIVIPLLGFSLGVKYMILKIISSFIQTSFALIYARIFMENNEIRNYRFVSKKNQEIFLKKVKKALKNSANTLKRVIPIFTLTMAFVYILNYTGALSYVSEFSKPITNVLSLPPESSIVVTTQFINIIAGYAMAGELFKSGLIGEKEALVTLAVGLIVSLPRIFAQSTLPIVASLFNKKLAIKIVIVKILVDVFSIATSLFILVKFWF